MLQTIQYIIQQLQQKNEKSFYLSFLRVAASLWFLKEILFRWKALPVLYSNKSFLNLPSTTVLSFYRLNIFNIKEHYMLLIYVCLALLVLNILGIGRNLVSILAFFALTLLYHLNNQFINSGDEMSMLLIGYLSVANTFSFFVLNKRKPFKESAEKMYNMVTNLAAYSIMINLCFAYFVAGLFKLSDAFWQNGTALHYFFNDNRYSIFCTRDNHVFFPKFFLYIINYGTLLLELTLPVLVWYKPTRNIVLLLALFMHIGIYSFLMIYGMSTIFAMQYGLFFSNDEIQHFLAKLKQKLPFIKRTQLN